MIAKAEASRGTLIAIKVHTTIDSKSTHFGRTKPKYSIFSNADGVHGEA
jgi:hypothetical protein